MERNYFMNDNGEIMLVRDIIKREKEEAPGMFRQFIRECATTVNQFAGECEQGVGQFVHELADTTRPKKRRRARELTLTPSVRRRRSAPNKAAAPTPKNRRRK